VSLDEDLMRTKPSTRPMHRVVYLWLYWGARPVKTREEFVKLRVRQDAEMLRIKLSYVSGSVLCEPLSRGLTAYIVEARD
jgi:hypothetical protein